MRIRQIKPGFWSDKVIARLPKSARLAYIGFWQLADDGGWIDSFDLEQAAAELAPYESCGRRERDLSNDLEALIVAGRIVRHDCGCLEIPHLVEHQRISGVRSFRSRDAHAKHSLLSATQDPLSDSPGRVSGKGRVGNGTERNGIARASANESDGLRAKLGDYSEIVR